MNLAIETRGLTRYFDDFCAVDHVELKVERGTLYGFLGPNGAGKSTTIKMLTGILAPSSGKVSLLGMNTWDHKEAIEIKKQIGVVPEDLALFDNLTAHEYLTFVGRMFLLPKELIRERIEELLAVLGLEDVGKKLTFEFSHGMKKKLALAAALLPNPELLFLDEPFEGVDAVTSRVIRELLSKFVSRGSTIFITSHVLEIVERICTHVGIIAGGKLVEQTSLDALRRGSSLEQRFLEIVGTTEGATQRLSWLEGPTKNTQQVDPPEEPTAVVGWIRRELAAFDSYHLVALAAQLQPMATCGGNQCRADGGVGDRCIDYGGIGLLCGANRGLLDPFQGRTLPHDVHLGCAHRFVPVFLVDGRGRRTATFRVSFAGQDVAFSNLADGCVPAELFEFPGEYRDRSVLAHHDRIEYRIRRDARSGDAVAVSAGDRIHSARLWPDLSVSRLDGDVDAR
jgi:ABC-2 type transport system ATP-binding protein